MLSGAGIDTMDDRTLAAVIQDTTVFYRVSPRHKLRYSGRDVKGVESCVGVAIREVFLKLCKYLV